LSKVSGVSSPVIISIRGLTRSFGDVHAVTGIDLDIYEGEFITLLGPSGSGKTTVLRMIAGFEKPDAGSISLSGKDVSQLPPYERDVNTVFQDYALFPHMNVLSNIEYGLRVKGVAKAERLERASGNKDLLSYPKKNAVGGLRRNLQKIEFQLLRVLQTR
jgi:putative spermidine/putrescine transport system ATP-binding protein